MRLFHVSEEPNINVFKPRLPKRNDLNQDEGLVWAICEEKLGNFLTPRECPRVCYSVNENTSLEDCKQYLVHNKTQALVIETGWLERLKATTLYLYEFCTQNFTLQDKIAGYYVSTKQEKPIKVIKITNILNELEKRNIHFRTLDDLSSVALEIKKSSFDWSLCRMRNAKKQL